MKKPSKLSARNKLLYGQFIKALCALEDAVECREWARWHPDLPDVENYDEASAAVDTTRADLCRKAIALSWSEPAAAA
jgi:hypothetical protein